MSNTRKYLIDVANLITLPDIYFAVKDVVDDPDANMNELTDLVAYDPAISTKLLKIANSSFYGQSSKVETIKKAVTLLGTRAVHDTVLSISFSHAFHSISGVNFDVSVFWQQSLMRAAVAKSLANQLKIPEPDRLFTLGILSDIGHMVLSVRAPALMKKVLFQHNKSGYPLYLFERSTFGFDAGELGADLLENWDIPDSIVTGVRYQNCPELAPEFGQDAAIIYCAGRLHPDEQKFPNMLEFEVLKQLSMDYLDFDLIRINASSMYDEAYNLFPTAKAKVAV